MKKLAILMSLFLCGTVLAKAQVDPFEKLMDMKGVTTVYISKAMLGMMTNMDSKNIPMVEGVDIGEVVKKLTSVTVLTSESSDAVKALQKLATDIKGNKAYEQLMFAKKDETKATIYVKELKDKESEMIMIIDDGSSEKTSTIIRLTGTMLLADIQKIAAEKK